MFQYFTPKDDNFTLSVTKESTGFLPMGSLIIGQDRIEYGRRDSDEFWMSFSLFELSQLTIRNSEIRFRQLGISYYSKILSEMQKLR